MHAHTHAHTYTHVHTHTHIPSTKSIVDPLVHSKSFTLRDGVEDAGVYVDNVEKVADKLCHAECECGVGG